MSELIQAGGQEVIGVNRIQGPILVVENGGSIGYDEVVEITDSAGNLRRAQMGWYLFTQSYCDASATWRENEVDNYFFKWWIRSRAVNANQWYDGEGIDPAAIPRLFDRFYRADEARAQPKGTGLGLAIAKEIIEAHGGTITVDAALGKGAAFGFELPKAPTKP